MQIYNYTGAASGWSGVYDHTKLDLQAYSILKLKALHCLSTCDNAQNQPGSNNYCMSKLKVITKNHYEYPCEGRAWEWDQLVFAHKGWDKQSDLQGKKKYCYDADQKLQCTFHSHSTFTNHEVKWRNNSLIHWTL